MKRRDFIKNTGLFAVSSVLANDPLIASFAKALAIPEEEYFKQFSHQFDLFREEDLLSLRFYLVNFEEKDACLFRKRKLTSEKSENSYMMVRIPQQHIIEETISTDNLTDIENVINTKAFISGYSYLTFRLKNNIDKINLSKKSLLNWNQFDLITLDYLDNLKDLSVCTFKEYPNILHPENKELDFFFDASGIKLPVSIFEVYKLFLSPTSPTIKGERGRTDIGYIFSKPENKLELLLEHKSKDKTFRITKPWENELFYSISYPDRIEIIPPHFKAIAYQKGNTSVCNKLIPSPLDREDIVKHTLLDFTTNNRNIISDYFKLGTNGLSTCYQYDNLNSIPDSNFVGLKQGIKNGRDNYVEIIYIGIDIRSGKKVLVSKIGERMHHKGRSLFVKRFFLSFIDKEQEYTNRDFPYSKSKILENGFYFKPIDFNEETLDFKKPANALVDNKCKDESDLLAFIPIREDAKENKLTKENLVYQKYIKYDRQGVEHHVKSHLAIILKTVFNDSYDDTVNIYNSLLSGDSKNILKDYTENSKIAYVNSTKKDGNDINKNTSLATDFFQFTTTKKSNNFYDKTPLEHHLQYANIESPQLDGMGGIDKNKFRFRYAKTYVDNEQKDAKVFFVPISKKIEEGFIDSIEKDTNNKDIIVLHPNKKLTPISKVVNNFNAKSLIDPDPIITGLSEFDQGIILSEKTVIKIDNDIKKINPADFLKGMNAELIKGIRIIDVLKQFIPFDETPVFEIIEEAQEGVKLIDNYKKDFDYLNSQLKSLLNQIKEQGKLLLANKVKEKEQYVKKYLDLEREKIKRYINENVTSPFEEEINDAISKVNRIGPNIANELVAVKEAEFDIIKARVNTLIENAKRENEKKIVTYEQYINTSISKLREENILGLISLLDFLNKNINDEYNNLAILIQNQLSGYRININNPTISLDSLENLKIYSNQGFIKVAKELSTKKKVEINAILIHKMESFIPDKTITTNTYDEVQKFFDAFKLALKLGGDEYILVKKQIDYVLYYYYENKLLLEKEYYGFLTDNELIVQSQQKNLKKFREYFILEEIIKLYLQNPENNIEVIIQLINDEYNNVLESYGDNIKTITNKYQRIRKSILKDITDIKGKINIERNKINKEIKRLKVKLNTVKYDIKNFVQVALEKEKNKLEQKNKELVNAIKDNATIKEINNLKAEVNKFEQYVKKILESNNKKINYTWSVEPNSFSDFKSNYVSFYKNENTRFEVDVKTQINYELSLEKPPTYKGTEVYSYNKLEDFRLELFSALTINIVNLSFETGTSINSKFDVDISDVTFSGPLAFMNALQKYVKALKFLQNLAQGGIYLDYSLPLPEIKGGAFNMLNIKLFVGVYLPLNNKKPLQLDFGFNSPSDMFLITYGIFGGRGCLQIGVTPKDGIVKILLILEFGGIILIDVGVAQGFVYLFAGIYYRKLAHSVEIRGYLVAGGVLDIAGLITASVTFVMGLKGDGKNLKGYCSVSYKVKIGMFFEKTFNLPYEKNIKGSESQSNDGANNKLNNNSIVSHFSEKELKNSSTNKNDLNNEELINIPKSTWKKYIESFKRFE
jgi:hypothetical protein